MNPTLIRSRHLSDRAAPASATGYDVSADTRLGEHSAVPFRTSAGAVVASDERFQGAANPSARPSRCAGTNCPPKEGCGQSEASVHCTLSAAGTQANWLVPM